MSVKKEIKKPDFLFIAAGAMLFILGGYWYGQAFSQPNPFESQIYYQAMFTITAAIGVEVFYFLKLNARLSTLEKNLKEPQNIQDEKLVEKSNDKKQTNSETDDLFIKLTQERISQELNNLSADEMKVNVLVAISVIFAIIAISGNQAFLPDNIQCWIIIPFFVAWCFVVLSFIVGIKVLKPRKDRFTLWDPKESENYYNEMSLTEARNKIKDELIDYFVTIRTSRKKDSAYIKWGYYFLFGGSIVMLITSLLLMFFGSLLCPVVQ